MSGWRGAGTCFDLTPLHHPQTHPWRVVPMETGAWEKRCARCFFLPFFSPFPTINWLPTALDCSKLKPPSWQVFSSVQRAGGQMSKRGDFFFFFFFASSHCQDTREPDCLHLAWLDSCYVSHKSGLSLGFTLWRRALCRAPCIGGKLFRPLVSGSCWQGGGDHQLPPN